jgi:hypothetical protein
VPVGSNPASPTIFGPCGMRTQFGCSARYALFKLVRVIQVICRSGAARHVLRVPPTHDDTTDRSPYLLAAVSRLITQSRAGLMGRRRRLDLNGAPASTAQCQP